MKEPDMDFFTPKQFTPGAMQVPSLLALNQVLKPKANGDSLFGRPLYRL